MLASKPLVRFQPHYMFLRGGCVADSKSPPLYLLALAEEIRHRLQETHRELSSVIDQLRGSSETDDGADTNAMTHIGQILGAHVDTLVWVHQRTDTLEQRLDTLERSKQAAPGLSGY
eukprot:m.61992 g.61992  ORF g.61992 m.61992 type:complete len:117 (-) comp17638_c0_seq1:1097-1447(-)